MWRNSCFLRSPIEITTQVVFPVVEQQISYTCATRSVSERLLTASAPHLTSCQLISLTSSPSGRIDGAVKLRGDILQPAKIGTWAMFYEVII
jgi:hypothetical protein